MKTEIAARVPVHYRDETDGQKLAEDAYAFLLCVSDDDKEHSHNSAGHAFPATREQLLALVYEIMDVLDRDTLR